MEHCGVPDNGFVPGGRKELAVDVSFFSLVTKGKPPADHSPRARHGPALLTRRSPTLGLGHLGLPGT